MANRKSDNKSDVDQSNNRRKSGIAEGRSLSKYNSLKHGILAKAITPYDNTDLSVIHTRLMDEYNPRTVIADILVERIALYILRLQRVVKAESEHIQKSLNPTVTKSPFESDVFEPVVVNKGYVPEINEPDFAPLFNLYHRYEKSLENRLYKAVQELEKLKQRGNA